MIHVGLFLLVFIFVGFRYLTRYDHIRILTLQASITMWQGFLIALTIFMLFAEGIFWAFYIIHQWITN